MRKRGRSLAVLTPEEELDLTGMRYHWETAYSIGLDDGVWSAVPHVANN